MKVNELSRDQLIELKQFYLSQYHDNISYGELANIDNIVSDDEVYIEYDGIEFVNDDFMCSAYDYPNE